MLLLLAGCGPAELYDELPDLSGRYRLVSWKSFEWTEGRTSSPPDVTGVLGLVQHRVLEGQAVGNITFELRINRPDGTGLTGRRYGYIYVQDISGGFDAKPPTGGFLLSGSYVFEDGSLITTLRRIPYQGPPPLLPNGTIRWEPCGPTWQDCQQNQ